MNKTFATAARPKKPPAPSGAIVKGFFGLMKTSAAGPLERMVDQYPGLLEAKGSPSGGTPLVYAAELGRFDLVKMFHEKGADLRSSDNGDQGALFYAGHHGWQDIAEYLINLGVNPLASNRAGVSPVMAAHANDLPSFGDRMARQREAYLKARQEETIRRLTENLQHGSPNAISAPEKASFKRKA